MIPSIQVVIPTYERGELLGRTLESLVECELPKTFSSVVVVENGPKGDAEKLVSKFTPRLPVQYKYVEKANKSYALNRVIADFEEDFVIFYDDDVRIDRQNLRAYSRTLESGKQNIYLSGRCGVDWEDPPPDWLLPYLPPSAKGWSKGGSSIELDKPEGMGFNWGAHASNIRNVGGFNENRGPGTKSRGQETDMMTRLFESGVKGVYVPDALVWHYVPKERCSEEWALDRAKMTAAYCGMDIARLSPLKRLRHCVQSRLRLLRSEILLAIFSRGLSSKRKFKHRYIRHWNSGVLEGVGIGAGKCD